MTTDVAKHLMDYAAHVAACKLDQVAEFYADDAVPEDLAMQDLRQGKAEIEAFYSSWHKALKNDEYSFTVERLIVAPDGGYALEYHWRSRIDSEVHGLPPEAIGRSFEIRGVGVGQVKNGKIAVWRDYYDAQSVATQLGLVALRS